MSGGKRRDVRAALERQCAGPLKWSPQQPIDHHLDPPDEYTDPAYNPMGLWGWCVGNRNFIGIPVSPITV